MTADISPNILSNYDILKPQIYDMAEIVNSEMCEETDINRRLSIKEAEDTVAELDPRLVEQLQKEANEETTKSEDLRQFLEEMHESMGKPIQAHPIQPNPTGIGVQSNIHNIQINTSDSGLIRSNSNRYMAPGSPTSNAGGMSLYENQNTLSPYKQLVSTYQESELQAMAAETAPMGPPDGGWAWFIVLASFFCMITIDGTCFNYGLLIPDMMADFEDKNQNIMDFLWPGSLIAGFYMTLCPITSALSNQFDFRPIAMFGSIISGLAILASSFTKSVIAFIVCFGIFGGIGFSLIYLPAIAVVGHWFHEKRPIAVGIALCGSGFGTMVFGQLIPWFTAMLTWRGTVVLISGVCFQTLVFIALFRPLELHLRLEQYYRIIRALKRMKREEQEHKRLENEKMAEEEKRKKKAEKEQLKQQQRMRNKKIVIYRGLIMQKIIEEKKRQRTVSMGSLDGMVITRDNELIKVAMSSVDIYEKPMLSVNAVNRIRESVVKRLENKIKKKGPSGILSIGDSRSIIGTESNINTANIKNSLSQLVQDYINSQISLQLHPLQRQSSINSSIIGQKIQSDDTSSKKTNTQASNQSHNNNTCGVNGLVLEDKAKAVIQASLRKEMTRPFCQKELFYSGSIKQYNSDAEVDKRSEMSLALVGGGTTACDQSLYSQQSSVNTCAGGVGGLNLTGSTKDNEDQLSALHHLFVSTNPASTTTGCGNHGSGHVVCNGATGNVHSQSSGVGGDTLSITTVPTVQRSSVQPSRRTSYEDDDDAIIMRDNDVDEDDEVCSLIDDPMGLSVVGQPQGSHSGLLKDFCRDFLDLRLLKNVTFMLMIVSNIIAMLGIFVPFFILPVYLTSLNQSTYVAGRLISYIGVANVFGRLISTLYIEKAWSSSYKWADCLWINNAALFLAGLSALSVPFIVQYHWLLIIVLVSYGFFVAAVVSLKSILVVELLGLENLTNSFSFLLIFQGIATILGAPIAGAICEAFNKNYEVAFYFAGTTIILSGILCFPLRWVANWERNGKFANQKARNGVGEEMLDVEQGLQPSVRHSAGEDIRSNLLFGDNNNNNQHEENVGIGAVNSLDDNSAALEMKSYLKDSETPDTNKTDYNSSDTIITNVSQSNCADSTELSNTSNKAPEDIEEKEDTAVALSQLEPLVEEEEDQIEQRNTDTTNTTITSTTEHTVTTSGATSPSHTPTSPRRDHSVQRMGKNDLFEVTTVT